VVRITCFCNDVGDVIPISERITSATRYWC